MHPRPAHGAPHRRRDRPAPSGHPGRAGAPSDTSPRSRLLPRSRSDRKSTRLNSSHGSISYAVFCLKKKKKKKNNKQRHEIMKKKTSIDERNTAETASQYFSAQHSCIKTSPTANRERIIRSITLHVP